jgi:hypothetical protein
MTHLLGRFGSTTALEFGWILTKTRSIAIVKKNGALRCQLLAVRRTKPGTPES